MIRLYDCGICGELHPWEWAGDCREDDNRYAGEDVYAERHSVPIEQIEVWGWAERVSADCEAVH
jgi:hypothetical protein